MIPVNVITGFLGSGKTTLLKEVLAHPAFADSAVIINEFGEVGLDHLLVEEVEEGILLLDSGCICCTIRSDLQETIRSLQQRVASGAIERFERLIIETTGIADPAPIVSTLIADPVFRSQFRLGNIVCLVDASTGLEAFERYTEIRKQIAVADRLLISKVDLAETDEVERLRERLARLNPAAWIGTSSGHGFDVGLLVDEDLDDPSHRLNEVRRWSGTVERAGEDDGGHRHDVGLAHGMRSFVLLCPEPLDWVAFGIWLTGLLHAHGEKVLRVKGILQVRESRTPVVIHGVQHVVHPPMHLSAWPDASRDSRIVFITQDLEEAAIRSSLERFMAMADALAGS